MDAYSIKLRSPQPSADTMATRDGSRPERQLRHRIYSALDSGKTGISLDHTDPAGACQNSESGHLVYCATEREPESESIRIIRLLHQYGKPIDDNFWQDSKSFRNRGRIPRGTPLHNACELYNFETAFTLLELGADIDKPCVRDNLSVGPSPREVIQSKLQELSASRIDAVGRRAASWMIADRERTARYATALERALMKPRMARIQEQHQQLDEATDTAVQTRA